MNTNSPEFTAYPAALADQETSHSSGANNFLKDSYQSDSDSRSLVFIRGSIWD